MSILAEIVRHKRQEVAALKTATPRAALEARCATLPPPRDLERALAPAPGRARLVAEVKKASPSRGVLKADLDPVSLATTYARHGVDAISVLTDAKYFSGSLDDLRAVRAAVDAPLLRKDFTLDEYQLWEARAAGADAILLIVAMLEPERLRDLAAAAKGLGLAALVECHTAAELDVALAIGARVIGINNRDLATFERPVGVFWDHPAGHVKAVVEACRLRAIQLHGAEKPEDWEGAPVPVIKTIKLPPATTIEGLPEYKIGERIGALLWRKTAAALL